jgi:hypothetical protein
MDGSGCDGISGTIRTVVWGSMRQARYSSVYPASGPIFHPATSRIRKDAALGLSLYGACSAFSH